MNAPLSPMGLEATIKLPKVAAASVLRPRPLRARESGKFASE